VRTGADFLSRQQRFRSVESTNDIVASWLAEGSAEVCLALADEQTSGRGRSGRTWTAPAGRGLLLSLGFRPTYLPTDRLWRLGAVVALAMADASEETAGLSMGKVRLKWPNDLVVEAGEAGLRKLAGILGESAGVGTPDVSAVVGIGINTDWPRDEFPAELAASMTSLREIAGGRTIDNAALLDAFLTHLEPRVAALRGGYFDVDGWHARQATTGRRVRVQMPDGSSVTGVAAGVDGASGALLLDDESGAGERELVAGEVVQVRLEPASPEKGVTN
jgi:BirA family biotin operon repressor/biotin-[acetyl-CoA-carboxylase] ligase